MFKNITVSFKLLYTREVSRGLGGGGGGGGGGVEGEVGCDISISVLNFNLLLSSYVYPFVLLFFGRFTEEEVEEMFNNAPMDRQGNLLYPDFCKTIKGGQKEEEEAQ